MAKQTDEKVTMQENDTVADYIRRAHAARESRKVAPLTSVSGFVAVPQKQLIAKHAEMAGDADSMFYMMGDSTQLEQLADRGFEPVIHNGKLVKYLGDTMVKCPKKLRAQELAESKARSDMLLGEKIKSDRRSSRRNSVSTGEQVTITRGGKALGADEG